MAEGQLLRAASTGRPLRRLPRRTRRLRRGAAPRAGAPAEAHRLRRLAYPRTVEASRFREIADEVGALLLCDMAHFAGLVAAGLHPNPVEHCDFVTSTTHKTLPGRARASSSAARSTRRRSTARSSPGMQGGPLKHVIAAKAACFRIAALGAVPRVPGAVRANADALAESAQDGGLDVLTGGTDTHLLPRRPPRAPSGRARTPRSDSPRSRSPSTATRCRSTSGRRPSRRASASARRR